MSDKRLAYLEKLVADGKADSFGRYCYALELKGRDRVDDALKAFEALREADAGYLAMYLMCGTMLLDAGKTEDARGWLQTGLDMAMSRGDSKTAGELKDALGRCS